MAHISKRHRLMARKEAQEPVAPFLLYHFCWNRSRDYCYCCFFNKQVIAGTWISLCFFGRGKEKWYSCAGVGQLLKTRRIVSRGNRNQRSGAFNYDPKYRGATARAQTSLKEDTQLSKDGFLVNHARVLLGSGTNTYDKAKLALENWRHFDLNWAFVDPKTPIQSGVKFCVCLKEFLPWVLMPLQVVYVNESRSKKKKPMASFGFGSGTLQGHLLAGEERFSIEMDENSQVWYETLSFSKPAHFLSFMGYPYVQLRQKIFAQQSTNAVLKHVAAS